ncbi:MAG TPA: peptidylprolyl isomerase [Actinomycetota bacterium]|nr:peptidylprolyl isomerase [Actinomycetota bacterium]
MRSRLSLLVAAAVLLSACGGFFDTAAAVVNGRRIDQDRFADQLDFLLADPSFAQQFPGEQGEVRRREFAREFLTFLIHQALVQDYAETRGITVPEDEIDARMDELTQQLGGEEAFDRQVQASGVTIDQVRDLVYQQALRQRVAEAVIAEGLSEESLRETYEQRIAEFTEVHVAHILVPSEAEAERIAQRATPENFAELAERFSQDPGSAPDGGDLGFRRPAELVAPFAEAMLETPEGEIAGPVETEFGFHVIHVIERRTAPFEEVRDQLVEEARGQIFRDWLLERVEAAEIRVNPRFGYLDEESGIVVPRTATTPSPQRPVQVAP